jgi:hypothetical protein
MRLILLAPSRSTVKPVPETKQLGAEKQFNLGPGDTPKLGDVASNAFH